MNFWVSSSKYSVCSRKILEALTARGLSTKTGTGCSIAVTEHPVQAVDDFLGASDRKGRNDHLAAAFDGSRHHIPEFDSRHLPGRCGVYRHRCIPSSGNPVCQALPGHSTGAVSRVQCHPKTRSGIFDHLPEYPAQWRPNPGYARHPPDERLRPGWEKIPCCNPSGQNGSATFLASSWV